MPVSAWKCARVRGPVRPTPIAMMRCGRVECRNHANRSGFCRIHRSIYDTNRFVQDRWFPCAGCEYATKTLFLQAGEPADQARRDAINARVGASRFVRAVPSWSHHQYEKYVCLGVPSEYRGEAILGFCELCDGYTSRSWCGWV